MTDPNQNIPELDGVLADAVEQLRQTSTSDSLMERCLANGVAIPESDAIEPRTKSSSWVAQWGVPLAIAASILVLINIAQAVARQPPPDRQLCAVLLQPDGQRQLMYSDRTIEPASDFKISNRGEDK